MARRDSRYEAARRFWWYFRQQGSTQIVVNPVSRRYRQAVQDAVALNEVVSRAVGYNVPIDDTLTILEAISLAGDTALMAMAMEAISVSDAMVQTRHSIVLPSLTETLSLTEDPAASLRMVEGVGDDITSLFTETVFADISTFGSVIVRDNAPPYLETISAAFMYQSRITDALNILEQVRFGSEIITDDMVSVMDAATISLHILRAIRNDIVATESISTRLGHPHQYHHAFHDNITPTELVTLVAQYMYDNSVSDSALPFESAVAFLTTSSSNLGLSVSDTVVITEHIGELLTVAVSDQAVPIETVHSRLTSGSAFANNFTDNLVRNDTDHSLGLNAMQPGTNELVRAVLYDVNDPFDLRIDDTMDYDGSISWEQENAQGTVQETFTIARIRVEGSAPNLLTLNKVSGNSIGFRDVDLFTGNDDTRRQDQAIYLITPNDELMVFNRSRVDVEGFNFVRWTIPSNYRPYFNALTASDDLVFIIAKDGLQPTEGALRDWARAHSPPANRTADVSDDVSSAVSEIVTLEEDDFVQRHDATPPSENLGTSAIGALEFADDAIAPISPATSALHYTFTDPPPSPPDPTPPSLSSNLLIISATGGVKLIDADNDWLYLVALTTPVVQSIAQIADSLGNDPGEITGFTEYQQTAYVTLASNAFGTLGLTNGLYTEIASLPSGIQQPRALASDDQTIWMSNNNPPSLYTIDPITGDATLVAPFTTSSSFPLPTDASLMEFKAGKLYLMDSGTRTLYIVNPANAELTSLGVVQVPAGFGTPVSMHDHNTFILLVDDNRGLYFITLPQLQLQESVLTNLTVPQNLHASFQDRARVTENITHDILEEDIEIREILGQQEFVTTNIQTPVYHYHNVPQDAVTLFDSAATLQTITNDFSDTISLREIVNAHIISQSHYTEHFHDAITVVDNSAARSPHTEALNTYALNTRVLN